MTTRTRDSAWAMRLLPHAFPFRFVDEIVEFNPGVSCVALWKVTGAEDFLRGHFPGQPIVPGVILAEALAQASGVASFSGEEDPRDVGTRARLAQVDVKFLAVVQPPAVVTLRTRLERSIAALRLHRVEALVDDMVVAKGTIALALVPDGAEP